MSILPDINVWLALALEGHGYHQLVRSWMRNQEDRAFFCRVTQQGLLRLLTTKVVVAEYDAGHLTNKDAWSVYDAFMAHAHIGDVEEPEGLEAVWRKWSALGTPSPKVWMDAYLAAFAMEAGMQLVTTDRAFKRFKGLDVKVLS